MRTTTWRPPSDGRLSDHQHDPSSPTQSPLNEMREPPSMSGETGDGHSP